MPVKQEDELKRNLKSSLTEMVVGIRDRRRLVEQQWLQNRRVWMNKFSEGRYTPAESGTGPYSIPAARRAAERTVVRCVKMLTPKVKWYEVQPLGNKDDKKLSNIDRYMYYILRKRIETRSNISQLSRSMLLYGRCHLKTSIMVKNGLVWPYQRPVDPFAYYIFPETSATSDEAEIQFEDFLFSYERYKTMVNSGIVEDIRQSDLTKPDWPYHLVERLAYSGITDPTANVDIAIDKISGELSKTTAAFVSLTELWITRSDKLYQVYIAWNCKHGARLVGFFQSQYDEPLYRSAVHRPLPGETYTNSMMEDIADLDSLQNDQLNKFQDAVDWEQGFAAINNSAKGRTDSIKMKGRALWEFSDDPRLAMQFLQTPVTSTNQLRAWQIYLSMINSMAGSGTIAEGQPGRNMPRAGFAMNALLEMGLADVHDVAEMIEQGVLTRSLGDIYKVSAQFIPDQQLIKIPGGQAMLEGGRQSQILKKSDIIGDYEFEWIGSLQSQDDQMRAQRSLIFLNMIPQLAPLMAQQGFTFDIVNLVRMIWRDALGERGLSDIVVSISEMQQKMLMQQLVNGMKGGGQQNGGTTPGLQYNLPTATSGFVQQS